MKVACFLAVSTLMLFASGGTVHANYSAASVESTVVSNNGYGVVDVHVETTNNGITHSEVLNEPVVPGVPVHVDIATSTGDTNSVASASVSSVVATSSSEKVMRNPASFMPASISPASSTPAAVRKPGGWLASLTARINDFFAHLFFL